MINYELTWEELDLSFCPRYPTYYLMPLGNLFTFLNINFCFEDGLIVPISQIVVEIK